MSGQIIAIGGGKMYAKETLVIDKFIVSQTRKQKPRALFIPTASCDNLDYYKSFQSIYGDILGCEVDGLFLINDKKILTHNLIREKITKADLIYVSGGNTLFMMKTWRRYGVDKLLIRAYRNGKILSGMSSGSICWFLGGFSDSIADKFILVKGIGLIKSLHCPHYNLPNVKTNYKALYKKMAKGKKWYLLDDNAALVISDKGLTVLKSNNEACAYLVQAGDNSEDRFESLIENKIYPL